jgi:choline dehydrogenase-like flavoprotein
MWGRQCYRWSDLDFEANAKEGIGVDWPIRYKDIAPWYSYVERFVGISGSKEGIPHLPDGDFLPPMEMNCMEQHVSKSLKEKKADRQMIIGRVANLTRGWNGRGPCQFRNMCDRGCPFGGYFSSNSATIPVAMNTGNLTLRPNSIVMEVIYDKDSKRAKGVRIVDAETMKSEEFFAKVIFLNASTLGTTSILLNSVSEAFPNGLGNSSDQVGRNLMDHHYRVGASGTYEGFSDKYFYGRRANGI